MLFSLLKQDSKESGLIYLISLALLFYSINITHAATPIASYSFDEIDWVSNGFAADSIAGRNATINGAVSRQHSTNSLAHTSTCAGAQFSGGTLNISGLPTSTTTGDKTSVSFWMYWDGTNSVMPMGWTYHDLWFNAGSFGFNSWNSDIYGISSSGLANSWHHVVAIFSNNQMTNNELYINGVKQTLTQRTSSPNNSRAVVNSSLRIGGVTNTSSYRFSGAIDEFKIYNSALSQAEVTTDFTYTSPAACVDPAPQSEGLIASYTFNDEWSSSSPLQDTTGNANGTINGAVTRLSSPASGNKPETCAAGQFNGGAIDIYDLPVSTGAGDKTSISFWMNWDGSNSVMPLGFHIHDLWTISGSFGFNTGGGDIYGIPSAGLANTWRHVTVVFTNNNVRDNKIYLDGVEQVLTHRRGSIVDSRSVVDSHLRLGGWWYNNGYRFRGQLDELKIYTGEISQATIDSNRTAASPCHNPIEYRFDEKNWTGAAKEVIDSSSNNYHGTAVKTQPARGLVCNAANFNGSNSIQVSSNPFLDDLGNGNKNYSVSFWLNLNSKQLNSWRAIIHKGSTNQERTFSAWLRPGKNNKIHHRVTTSSSSNEGINSSKYTLQANQWEHIVLVKNDNILSTYINGTLDTQQKINNSINNSGPLYIGDSPWYNGIVGLMDELLIFEHPLSATEINDIRKNNLNGDGWDGQTRTCPPQNNLDHFEFSYTKNGLACLPSEITIKACADASCATLITDDVDVTFSPATGWKNNPTTISNGQATLNLNHPTPGNLPLSITASSITPANKTLSCLADGKADLTCSIDVAETGFIFEVPTLTACKPSANVTIKAVKTGGNTTQCVSALTGTKTLSFWSEYDIPVAGNNKVKINGSDIATSNAGTNIDLNFDINGEAQFTVQYDDAGQLNLTGSYDDGNGLSMTGMDSFVSTPVAIVSYSEDNNADCTSQNANCSVFKKAGEKFNQTIKAACWTHDGDTDYTDNPETPNFILASIGINSKVLAPASGVNGQLKENSFNFSSSDKGIHTLEQTISEVGVFEFSLTVPTYFTETLNSVTSPAIGRFIPDHFKTTTGTDGSFGNGACTGFSYSGQTFSYQTKPQLIVTAYNSETPETITQNYQGDFAKLDDTDLILTTPVADANQLGADNTNLVQLDWQPGPPALNDNSDGTLTFTFGDDNYTYTQEANSQIAPFVNAVDLTFTQVRDSDGINASTLPYTLQPSGENIYFGRVALDSAHGSELAPLAIGFRTEYFNGAGWLPNTQDQCTSISLTNHIRLKVDGGSFQAGNSTMAIQSGTTSATLANNIISGDGSISLSAPGEDNQGYVDIRTNMSATHPWLVDIINGEAQSRASFGLFRGDDKIIFRRERY